MRPQFVSVTRSSVLASMMLIVFVGASAAQTESTAVESSVGSTRPSARSFDELVDLVEKGFGREREENRQREARFLRTKQDQAALLEHPQRVQALVEGLRLAGRDTARYESDDTRQ